MKFFTQWISRVVQVSCLIMLIGTAPAHAQDTEPEGAAVLEEVLVETQRVTEIDETRVTAQESISASPDVGDLVKQAPGANLASNGPVSGQVQYRGMTGGRLNVQVNGQAIKPVGPNWMDSPLHYASRPLLEEITVSRGIAPVSGGIMTLGGTVNARMKTSHFTEGDQYEFHGELFGMGRPVDDGGSGGGLFSYANQNRRFHAFASTDQGGDRSFPGGEVGATEHDRVMAGFGFGARIGGDTIQGNFRHTDTGKTGNPSLPQDIILVETEQVQAKYSTEWNGNPLELRVEGANADHRMDNFSLRPAPDLSSKPMMNTGNPGDAFDDEDRRFVIAESEDLGAHASTQVPYWYGTVKTGLSFTSRYQDVSVFDPNPESSFFVQSFNDIEREQLSGFAEWTGPLTEIWSFNGGLRVTRVEMEADRASADAPTTPPPLERLRERFNDGDRDSTDWNVDLVAEFSRSLRDDLDMSIGFARKTRSPSYIERFAWVPIEATAGLADGNNHVGNLNLDPEVSRDVELSFDWTPSDGYITPRFFYRDVDDYIQGTRDGITGDEETVSGVNGDRSPLKFNNVDAEIYGLDASWGYDLPDYPEFSLDGTVSFLKGERSDTDDDLYRFSPPQARARIHYEPLELETWRFTAEGVFVDEQDDVSETNDETPTPGYGLLNLKAHLAATDRMNLTLGLNNVFDKFYRDHLSGFNRVRDSDVDLGRRLPGNERNLVVNLTYEW